MATDLSDGRKGNAVQDRFSKGSNQIKILLIEDDPSYADLVKETLQAAAVSNQAQLALAETLAEAMRLLNESRFDVVLLDISLPDSQGLETFIRLYARAPETPIILLTGVEDESLGFEAVRAGAQEYIVKRTMEGKALWRVIFYAIERHSLRRFLREGEQRYKRLLESVTDYIYTANVEDGRVVSTTHGPACVRVTGYTSQDFDQDSYLWYRMVHDEDRFLVRDQAAQVLAGHSRPLEHRMVHKDGSVRWVRHTPVLRRDEQGRVIGYDGLISDITEQKQAVEALRESEKKYRDLFESSRDAILLGEYPSGRFISGNPASLKLFGVKNEEELISYGPVDLSPERQPDGRLSEEKAKEMIEKAIREGSHFFEWTHRRINGEEFFADVLLTRLERDGKILILATVRDITERKRTEEEIRTAQLHLIQAAKMEVVGRMTAGVAHEVQNPLQILLMSLDYLSQRMADAHDAVLDGVINDMRLAARRADTIIRGLLDFSHSNTLELKPQDLNALIEEALLLVRHNLASNHINLQTTLAPGLSPLALDGVKIEQVFVNLFTNAIDAMPEGGALTVKTSRETLTETHRDPGSREAGHFYAGDAVVTVDVEDTGSGISPEVLRKMFDPFFTTKTTGKGTGLGMAIVKRILDLHGASIEIRNRPAGGAHCRLLFKTRNDN